MNMRLFANALLVCFSLTACSSSLSAQAAAKKNSAASAVPAPESAISLAEKGYCRQAMPSLLHLVRQRHSSAIDRRIGFDGLKCARLLNSSSDTVAFLLFLTRKFPHDPEVLYVATHAYSDLATHTSDELLATAPNSVPAQELDAEALEVQGKWQRAEDVYRKILAAHPHTPGIHFRIGRVILSEPKTPETAQLAEKQFEAELQIDPRNADAEYVLGELARENENWPDAIKHFTRATQLDPGFQQAFLGLGMALNSAERYSEAVAPLSEYVKSVPADPTGHYQLAIAYNRVGRAQEASEQIAIFQKASQAAAKAEQGSISPSHTNHHPQQ